MRWDRLEVDAGGEIEEGNNMLGGPRVNRTVVASDCYCRFCNMFIQSTGVQKHVEHHISDKSIQVVFLLLLFTVLPCSVMSINEINSRSPGTKVPQQLSRTVCQFIRGPPGAGYEPDVTPWVAAAYSGPWGLSTVQRQGYTQLWSGEAWESYGEWGQLEAACAEEQCTRYTIILSLFSSCP